MPKTTYGPPKTHNHRRHRNDPDYSRFNRTVPILSAWNTTIRLRRHCRHQVPIGIHLPNRHPLLPGQDGDMLENRDICKQVSLITKLCMRRKRGVVHKRVLCTDLWNNSGLQRQMPMPSEHLLSIMGPSLRIKRSHIWQRMQSPASISDCRLQQGMPLQNLPCKPGCTMQPGGEAHQFL